MPEGLTDTALEALLFVRGGPAAGVRRKPEPDWASLHRELRRAGVTLMLLWQEYRAGAPEGYGRGATLVTSQIPVDRWHDIIGEPTIADAILDRIVHNAHRLKLKGDSMRRKLTAQLPAA